MPRIQCFPFLKAGACAVTKENVVRRGCETEFLDEGFDSLRGEPSVVSLSIGVWDYTDVYQMSLESPVLVAPT